MFKNNITGGTDMKKKETHMVTGAFGYTGKYITRILLNKGIAVRTLTNSIDRENSFGSTVQPFKYNFDNIVELQRSLEGCSVLYNTYWVRFNHEKFNHNEAVANTIRLFKAAKQSGVKRIVHVSITNPDVDSGLEYFAGKGLLEQQLQDLFDSYAILRPAVIFGDEDILIHNIAWFIRNFPVVAYFGNGKYKLQPIHVENLAQLAVDAAYKKNNLIIDAIGTETYEYRELFYTIANILGKKRLFIPIPPIIGYMIGWVIGKIKGDVLITREEIKGLMDGLLYVKSEPTGQTRLSEWLLQNADSIGKTYKNEIARREDRIKKYSNL